MPVSVLSWNVHNRPGEGLRPRRFRHIAEQVAASGAEICCLQEVGPALLHHLEDLLPDFRCYGQPRALDDEAVPVLVRRDAGRVRWADTFWIGSDTTSGRRSWDARLPRCATAVEIELAAGSLAVLSCHLDHRGRQARVLGADQLAGWAAEHRPVVVAGDLNAAPNTPAYHRLVGPPPLLQDARRVARRTSGPDHTWSGPGGFLRRRIDHLLVDHQLHVLHHRTLPTPSGRRAPSDHSPVLADLALPGETPC